MWWNFICGFDARDTSPCEFPPQEVARQDPPQCGIAHAAFAAAAKAGWDGPVVQGCGVVARQVFITRAPLALPWPRRSPP